MKTSRFLTVFMDYLLMTIGSVIFCMAWTSFLIPNGLASGGLTGLCTIIQYGIGIPIGITYPVINILLLILGFLCLGKAFGSAFDFIQIIWVRPVKVRHLDPPSRNALTVHAYPSLFCFYHTYKTKACQTMTG